MRSTWLSTILLSLIVATTASAQQRPAPSSWPANVPPTGSCKERIVGTSDDAFPGKGLTAETEAVLRDGVVTNVWLRVTPVSMLPVGAPGVHPFPTSMDHYEPIPSLQKRVGGVTAVPAKLQTVNPEMAIVNNAPYTDSGLRAELRYQVMGGTLRLEFRGDLLQRTAVLGCTWDDPQIVTYSVQPSGAATMTVRLDGNSSVQAATLSSGIPSVVDADLRSPGTTSGPLKGTVKVDLSKLAFTAQRRNDAGALLPPVRDNSQDQLMSRSLEATAGFHEAEITLWNTDAISRLHTIAGPDRQVEVDLNLRVALHGHVTQHLVPARLTRLTFTFQGATPSSLRIQTLAPIRLDLAAHDVVPRDHAGFPAPGGIPAGSATIAEIALDVTAPYRGTSTSSLGIAAHMRSLSAPPRPPITPQMKLA